MNDLTARISALSPEKQRLLERMRRQQDERRPAPRPLRRPGAAPLSEPFSLVSPEDRERLPPGLEDAYPLSLVQLGMLFHMQLTPDAPTPTYHNVNSFNLRVPFDREALEEAAQRLVARHPILRTSFALTGYSEPLQLVHREARLPIPVEDLRGLAPEEQARAIERFLVEENRRLVDLSQPPLIRFHVHRRSERGIQFTLTEPHAILDGWSTMSNLSEVFAAYFALLRGEPAPEEPPITATYRDFVFLERQVLRSEEARSFWRERLQDWEMPRLPRWRGAAAGFGREERKPTFTLAPDLVSSLESLARSAGLPLKSLLLAVHLKVMGRITGRADAVTGITVHGRPEDLDGERVRGLFLNTIPIRMDLAGGSWLDLARRALHAETEALPFRRYPLAALQQLCGRELFEANFTYLHFHNVQGVVGRDKVGFAFDGHSDLSVTNFPLAVTWIRNPVEAAELTLTLERNDPGISLAEVRALAGYYERALAAMAAEPQADHDDQPLLSAAERHQVVKEWNDTAAPFAAGRRIHELFEERAAADPEALAVTGEDGRLSYGEVEERANRLAHRLAELGAGPGAMVGVCLERSVEMVPALLGILKAGGTYVPLSDSFPPARMEWILATLGVRHLVTQTFRLESMLALRHGAPGLAHLICVDAREELGRLPSTPPGRRGTADDLAYVIFTSGSTGKPKGVAVRHRPVVNLIEWALSAFAFGPADRVLFVTSLSFDLSVFDVFGLLAAGGSIHVASRRDLEEPERLVRLLRDEPVTFWDSAPAALQQLAPFFPEALPGVGSEESRLRLVFLSGDWIPLTLPGRVRAGFPDARVVSLGGATEATVWSNVFPVGEIDPAWVSIPYGRPIPNARYHVLDGALLPCPVGAPGDLYIGGDCLSSGYAAAPDLTADRYLPDPFGDEPGGRLYRTGDRARFFPDGLIEFLGRLDHQVKIRGFRIELGEIEAALAQHEGVREAAVLVREDVPGQRRLVAYVVPRREPAPGADELRRFLLSRLPDYMVPAACVPLPALPVTANGKLDRGALPVPETGALAGQTAVPPRTALEREVAEVWSAVLGRPAASVHDNFFELGGDSLLAIQLVLRLRETLGIDLPLRGLFEHSTVAGLALAVARLRGPLGAGKTPALPAVTPAPADGHEPFPLTDLQQAYWLGERADFDLGGMSAHVYQERDFADLDPVRLEATWNRLVERHPMLRAVVLPDGRQRVLAAVPPYRVQVIDLRGLGEEPARPAAAGIARRMADQGPPAGEWPLFELRLTRWEERWRLHVSLSLLICDAVGLNVLHDELRRLYADPGASLPELELSFRDYVLAMGGDEGSEAFARSRDYWLARLPSLPPAPELPVLPPAAGPRRVRFVHHGWRLGAQGWRRFRERAARAGVTPTAAVLTAYAQTLAAWSKGPRFTLNVLYFNRLPVHPQVDRVVGNFSSTLPLEFDGSGVASFAERARRLQDRLWQDLEHGRFSGVRVVRELARLHGVSARPVLPVVFTSDIQLGPPVEEVSPEQVDAAHFELALQTPQVWLDHQASELAGRLVLAWQVVEGLFPPGVVEEMFDAYCALVERLGGEEDLWREPLEAMPPAVHLEKVARVNATVAPIASQPLHAAFCRRAGLEPGAPAVLAAGRSLSYGELAGLAAHLAARLRRLGAGPGERVAVVLEKGWEQAVAVLAVLAAGAAYLPVDPALPRQRRRHLLEAGAARIALTAPGLPAEEGEWPEGVIPLAVPEEDEPVAGEIPDLAAAAPGDLAYVIFTSGSTGLPKGVAIEHGSAWNTVADVDRRFGLGPEDRVLALSSLAFDLSVWDLFGPLSTGGAVVVPRASDLREPARWVELMERHRVTVWSSVPALLEMLVDHLEGRGELLPPSLRLVLLSGDWIPVSLPDRIRRLAAPGIQVVSLGGATEASIWSILYEIEAVDPASSSIPYGRPMANQTFHVLDGELRPRPAWVPGDLYIGGAGLARGYWRDEERTRASFVVHPRTGERLYRTGDLGRWLPDGDIEFLGREDLQVKIQGYRIELGEIEAALLAHPGVRAAVAVASGPLRGAKRLVAYAVPAAGGADTLGILEMDELRRFLAARLPSYMVPAALVVLDELPLTANGKVDRRALPHPDDRRPARAAVPPRDELETALARIWSDVLDSGPVSVHDDFFELGGHSLLAVRLMGRIQAELGRDLPLSALFGASTLAALAALSRQEPAAGGRPALVAVREEGAGLPFFCVHPVGGNVLCYRDLAREMGEGRPFYALQTPGGEPAGSIEAMAASYLEAIREVQPHGPYRLGGWSMGGVVAYEMARQLESAGEEVELLALIDPWTPGLVDPDAVDDAVLASWFLRDLGGLAGVSLDVNPDELRPLAPEGRASRLLERAQAAGVLPPDFGPADFARHLEMFQRNFRILLRYAPGEHAGGAALFLAADGGEPERAAEVWTRLSPGAAVRLLLGDHYTLVQPPRVAALAREISAALAREMLAEA